MAVPAVIDLAEGHNPSAGEWIAITAMVPGIILWPFGAGNVRTAAAYLGTVRRRIYGDS